MLDTETGELIECRLEHGNGEAKKFYAELPKPVRVGMDATGYAQWFEQMLAKLGRSSTTTGRWAVRHTHVKQGSEVS